MRTTIITLSLAAVLGGCGSPDRADSEQASPAIMYHHGDILTMAGDEPAYAEALVVRDGKILFVGAADQAMEAAGPGHRMVDLQGRTLLPGFIDGHAHFHGFGAQAITANLLASPDGTCDSMDQLVTALKDWHAANGTDKTQGWIIGMGYDDAVLAERRHPTRDDLDKVSTDVPIMCVHISGHFCTVNSKGLEVLGITAATEDPAGGVIRRMKGSREPNGVLEELAAIPRMLKTISPTDPALADLYLDRGQEMAASYGYTTANEGRAMTNHEQLADYAKRGKFYLDVVADVDYLYPQYMRSEWYGRDYTQHYRVAGYKLTLDGSPQGRTAWRTTPYLLPPDGQQPGYAGYPAVPDDADVQAIVDSAFANDWQLKVHCNGDAALDQLCRALTSAVARYGNNDRRTALIHGQLIRMDQLDSLKKYDVLASLFPMHTFYWGDWYKQIIGPEAAQHISPIRSALNKGLRVNSHTDAPVALPNLMMILHTTVNRVSRSGDVIGPEERLTPYEALKCITLWGAEMFFEEDRKGTLEAGKLADLVVLDANPLKVEQDAIKDIQVLETIKEGESVYRREG
ncbi:MAG: amidohydrolase [Flavobacteriales bacterium]|nr:amidohydrolase [Flavobacteriales bacterium]